jgi:O-antigen ligase
MFVALLLLLALAYAAVVFYDRKMAAFLLLGLLPTYLIRFSIGPFPSTLLEIFVLLFILAFIIKEKAWRIDYLRTLGVYRAPLLLLLGASCFAVTFSPDPLGALGIWKSFFLEPILLFFAFKFTFTERGDFVKGVGMLGLTVVGIAVFAIFQSVTGIAIPAPWDLEVRATSVFDFPNAVGLFVAPLVSAFIIFASSPHLSHKCRTVFGVFGLLGIIACILSETEATYIAIPAALLIILAISRVSTKIKLSVIVPCIVLGVLAVGFSSSVRQKITLHDTSGEVRRSQWTETAELLTDHPFVGAGLNGYPEVFKPYHNPRLYEVFQYPHNILLNFWVELGLLGVIALLVFLVSVSQVVAFRRDDVIVLAAAAALLTMCIHGLVDVPFFKNDLAILTAFFLAMTLVKMDS